MSNQPHEPDQKTRKTVEAMSSYGIPQEDIAKVIGIDPKTLRLHYRYELDTAETKANAQVASRLYQKCMKDDTSSIIFWLKTRAKWKDASKDDVAGDNGNIVSVLSKLIDKLPS
jgi:hypothetical protein